LDNLLSLLHYLIETNGYKPPTEIVWNLHDPKEWALLLIYAPIIEELAFRGWMNGRKRNLIALAAFAPVLLYEYTTVPMGIGYDGFFVLFAVSIFCIPVWWALQSRKPQPIPNWFSEKFGWIVYASATAFGLIHVFNFSDFEWGPDLLYILPQAVGGLMMAYTRLRLGLFVAMLHHALFNACFLAVELVSAA
jgi:membrane protease YdiL (CAAX protease family)